jgi:hypothetical protein
VYDEGPSSSSSSSVVVVGQTYPVAALLATLTFLLTFRVNNSYGRWWEAYTSAAQMHAKLLDVGTCLSSFCLGSDELAEAAYHSEAAAAASKAPDRAPAPEMTVQELHLHLVERMREERLHRRRRAPPSAISALLSRLGVGRRGASPAAGARPEPPAAAAGEAEDLSGGGAAPPPSFPPAPSSFLEEAAHLLSLLSAVCFASLRDDLPGVDPPLIAFDPAEPYPHVDPDDYQVSCF